MFYLIDVTLGCITHFFASRILDPRITEATRAMTTSPKPTTSYRRVLPLISLGFFLLVTVFCLYFIIGEELERQAWLRAPSTLSLYTTTEICTENGHILNCGHCGACSNIHDIRIYHETAQTLTGTMTWCAFEGFFLGKDHTRQCLQEKSDLSTECAICWVGNSECNKRHCRRTCLHHRVFPFLPTWKAWDDPRLDPCITCDEKFCGPEFVACAGANRRRVGVVSDLQRDMDLEMCTKTDWDYVLSGDSEVKNSNPCKDHFKNNNESMDDNSDSTIRKEL